MPNKPWRYGHGCATSSGSPPADRRYIREQLIAASVEQGGVPDDGPTGFSASAIERIALATVRSEQWDAAALWISALPPNLAAQPRWRYWRGRALIDGGEAAEAGRGHLAAIAGLRTYYGFLAAADLGAEPKLNAEPPRHDYARSARYCARRRCCGCANCTR